MLQNVFDQPVKYDIRTYDNIPKVATGHGDDYRRGCLVDYPYFKENYKFIAVGLNLKVLDADTKAKHQIIFTENLDRVGNTAMFFIIQEVKETIFDFLQGTVRVL